MEELKKQQASFPWLRVFIIAYGISIVLSLAGVVLGAINFAAGPVRYPSYVLVLWLLTDILLFVAVALHLAYYGIEMGSNGGGEVLGAYALLVGGSVIGGGIALLVNKHFGWFSASALAILVVCGVIDVILAQRGK
jgi:hypothetical protein